MISEMHLYVLHFLRVTALFNITNKPLYFLLKPYTLCITPKAPGNYTPSVIAQVVMLLYLYFFKISSNSLGCFRKFSLPCNSWLQVAYSSEIQWITFGQTLCSMEYIKRHHRGMQPGEKSLRKAEQLLEWIAGVQCCWVMCR